MSDSHILSPSHSIHFIEAAVDQIATAIQKVKNKSGICMKFSKADGHWWNGTFVKVAEGGYVLQQERNWPAEMKRSNVVDGSIIIRLVHPTNGAPGGCIIIF